MHSSLKALGYARVVSISRHSVKTVVTSALLVFTPVHSAVVTLGDVDPYPTLFYNPVLNYYVSERLAIGDTGSGSVAVNGGSLLQPGRMWIGGRSTGRGELTISGQGSQVGIGWPNSGPSVDIGGSGSGTMSVLSGGMFLFGDYSTACIANCLTVVGNGAGSEGVLKVGTGAVFHTPGRVVIGQASVFSPATDGVPIYGTPSGHTRASVVVEDGGRFFANSISVAQRGFGLARTGGESVDGEVVLRGTGTQMTLGYLQGGQASDVALLSIGSAANSSGRFEVLAGASVSLQAGEEPGPYLSGINIGSVESGAAGVLRVAGAGSEISQASGTGFLNIGNAVGAQGELQISGGGRVGREFSNLPFASIGRRGGDGTLTLSGVDNAGNASTLYLSGQDPRSGAGAFLYVGRGEGGVSSHGTASILAGGRLEIDTARAVQPMGGGQPGALIGVGDRSTASLTVSGRDTFSGLSSTLSMTGGTGAAQYLGIGRDGASGTVTISQGGRLVLDSRHVSTSTGAAYAPGDAMILDIGRRADFGTSRSTGTVTVTGAGSELALAGTTDRIINIGRGSNARGTLNIINRGQASALAMRVGDGASPSGALEADGRLTIDDGLLYLGGAFNGGLSAGSGASLSLGLNQGFGHAAISNHSVLTIASTAPRAGWQLGGSAGGDGGIGNAVVSGGSVVTLLGDEAQLRVGSGGRAGSAGVGRLDVVGDGTRLSASGKDARVLVAAGNHTVGQLVIGFGAAVSASSLVGVAHDGNADTNGLGELLVNGTLTAPRVVIGSTGHLGGSGTVVGDVENRGTVNPGESPGRLTIDGGFDGRGGTLVIEIERGADGGWRFDELVFGDASRVFLEGSKVEFAFSGATNPEEFLAAGLFDLETFFYELDDTGQLMSIDARRNNWFDSVTFSARADRYRFADFMFSADGGAVFSLAEVPEPATLGLALLGLLVFGTRRRLLRP